ncbi:gliding motility-associated C-terminal domain-containing protein [Flavobacteriales bacterium]|nr:gliding motility-associated C-terminal domain-containing protein [Flavobacteriales bacterium]
MTGGGVDENNLSTGIFPVTVSDINNCSTTGTATINEPSEIQVTELTNNVSCFGFTDGNTSLQISGGITPYTEDWFGINTNLLAPGNYPYQLYDGNNCIKNGNINITEPELLEITSIDVVDIDCYGENTGIINPNVIGGTIPYSQDFGMYNPNYLTAGDYPFSVTDANGCSTNSTATITQSEEIFLDFIATSPICRDDESTLSIQISNSNFNTYTVSLQDSILKSYTIDTNGLLIATGLPIILTPSFSCDPVIISLTDEYGCTTLVNDNVHIEVKQLPVLALNEPDICIGTPSFTLLNATPTGGTYKIEGVSTDFFDASNLNPGNYNISYSYTDPITSCANEKTEILTISESPRAGMLFSPQPANISDPNIFFRDNSNEEVLISEWDLGDGTLIYDDLSFWHTYNDIGSYTIRYYITNLYGCTDSVVKQLNINPNYSTYIPNSFTPNNDGDNDVFFPKSVGYKSYNIKIFDRWGGIIFDEDDLAWDGNTNGKIIGGLYNYTIKILDFKDKPFIYTGVVNLIR